MLIFRLTDIWGLGLASFPASTGRHLAIRCLVLSQDARILSSVSAVCFSGEHFIPLKDRVSPPESRIPDSWVWCPLWS